MDKGINDLIDNLYKMVDNQNKIINEQALEISQLKNQNQQAIEYIKNHTLIGELDGQKVIMNEFHILASPKELLEILGDKE